MDIDRARRRDQPFAVAHRGAAGDDQARIDAVHDRRIAGLSDADDAAVANAEVAFDDSDDGSMTTTLQSRKSSAPSALVMPAMPIPSRRVLPPPCRHSSP